MRVLESVPDPRARRGVRYPFVANPGAWLPRAMQSAAPIARFFPVKCPLQCRSAAAATTNRRVSRPEWRPPPTLSFLDKVPTRTSASTTACLFRKPSPPLLTLRHTRTNAAHG